MTASDARNVFGWMMVVGALVVAFGVGMVLAARWPFAAVLVVSHAAVAAVTWWRTDRGLREEVAGLTERHDAWNRQAKSTDLAEIGPVTPPRAPVDPYPYPGRPEGLARRGISEAIMVNGGCVRCARDHEGFILFGGAWFALCGEHYGEVVEISMEGV